jgi:predicted ATPase/class 3 adenylate cyclase
VNAPPLPADRPVALLLTDLVDSAALAQRLGDEAMARVWAAHDRVARDLLRTWRGREIDKTDGFLLMFAEAVDALGYVLDYHRALHALQGTLPDVDGAPLRLHARAGLHVGEVSVRENPAADVALGAKPLEVDGVTKPLAARVMSTALGGQTLITAAARDALGTITHRVVSHGHWRVKGLPVPLELLEVGEPGAPFTPPPDAEKVYRVVRQGDLWLPARETRHTLPAERDAFVGRRSTLQELARRFDGGARLVSLLGIGGCGKTRVATRFGWQWLGDFPGGVWFCDLAAARTLEGLYSAVAQGLDVPLGPDDPVQQLGHAIAGRGPCLVVLDNFEQLARHAEDTVGQWLERAGAARFLVTTREVLGISGEDAVALAPMQDADAQALFLRRAASARRDFEPSEDDEAAIGPLVKLLDGLPLAIELAAARVRTLTPRALLARMSERFKLLASSGSRVDRQATLRATFDWSWDLLTPAERSALAQLSVFEGGFTLEAAEAVIDLEHLPQAPWTMDVIQSLVDKSFVRSLPDERFDLLGSVQAYALEKLEAESRPGAPPGDAKQSAQTRHGDWFAALGPQRALEHRCIELDNLAAACRRATSAGQANTAAGALDGAWAALNLRGPYQAGLDLAQALCALPSLPSRAAARSFLVLGSVLEAMGRRAQATPALETALQHARGSQDRRCEAAACVRLGALHGREGRSEDARAEFAAALQGALDLGDAELECAALNGLGTLEFEQGQLGAAQQHYEAALARARDSGDRRWQGNLLSNLANLHANLGRLDLAGTLSEEALAIARQLGDRQREGTRLSNLGMLHYLQGRLDAAEAACRAALTTARELGHVRLECTVLANLGLVQAAAGRAQEAVDCHRPALALARQLGNRRTEAYILGHLGVALARLGAQGQPGRQDEARQHLQAGLAILRAGSDPLSLALLLCCVAECEALVGQPEAAGSAWSEALALAEKTQAGPASELGLALARLQPLLNPGR